MTRIPRCTPSSLSGCRGETVHVPSCRFAMSRSLRPYLPNTSDRLAMVSLDDERPFRAFWPARLTQIVGGRTWSLSFIRYRSSRPVLITEEPHEDH